MAFDDHGSPYVVNISRHAARSDVRAALEKWTAAGAKRPATANGNPGNTSLTANLPSRGNAANARRARNVGTGRRPPTTKVWMPAFPWTFCLNSASCRTYIIFAVLARRTSGAMSLWNQDGRARSRWVGSWMSGVASGL